MSVRETHVIDAIGINNETNYVTLAIFDDLDWSDTNHHFYLLQEKINAYLSFIESGEIYTVYEHAVGRLLEIKIHFKYDMPQICKDRLHEAAEVINQAGFDLKYIISNHK